MSVASWCCKSFCVVPCVSFCTGHFVMVPLNMTCLHCLQHSLFEHLFNFYYMAITLFALVWTLFFFIPVNKHYHYKVIRRFVEGMNKQNGLKRRLSLFVWRHYYTSYPLSLVLEAAKQQHLKQLARLEEGLSSRVNEVPRLNRSDCGSRQT